MTESAGGDFAELLARAGTGDRAAEEAIVREYEPKVRMVARVLLGPALRPYLESGDLAQSVHRSIILGLREGRFSFAGPEQLVGLALTILRRKAAKHWRKLQRQQRLSGDRPANGELADTLANLADSQADPAEQAQYRDQLRRLCDELDHTEQRVLALRLDGFMLAEIADELGVSRVALRVRMTRLRQRLHAAGVAADWL